MRLANDALGDGLDVVVLGSRQKVEEGAVGELALDPGEDAVGDQRMDVGVDGPAGGGAR